MDEDWGSRELTEAGVEVPDVEDGVCAMGAG